MVTGSHASPLPAPDERLVVPDRGYELVAGQVVPVSPAKEPHGVLHGQLSVVLGASLANGYSMAIDMLTRASDGEDFAPDVSIYPSARDPATGGRQLEALAFEVVSTETLAHAGNKAASLLRRGVRRVFAIDVERGRGLEYSFRTGTWEILASDARIDDPALVIPLSLDELVSVARTDDAVARAMIAKRNRVIVQAIATERTAACAAALLRVLEGRGLAAAPAERDQILATRDEAALMEWMAHAGTCASVAELLARER